ncbi:MAG: hypothetical protein QXO21_05150 [Candidatus Anstonellales archaeon]
MSCENCSEAYKIDKIEPPCWDGECIIPEPGKRGKKILMIRDLLVRLHNIVSSEAILKHFDVSLDDLELLAIVEDEINKRDKK